jgi:hypothetical protein
MCDFCSREFPDCAAKPVFAREMEALKNAPSDLESVVACDLYESPVDVLKRKFH